MTSGVIIRPDRADDVALADQRDRRRPAQHLRHGLAAALERHPHRIGALLLLQLLHVERERRRRGDAQRAGLRLRQRDELVDRRPSSSATNSTPPADLAYPGADRLVTGCATFSGGSTAAFLEQVLVVDQRIGIDVHAHRRSRRAPPRRRRARRRSACCLGRSSTTTGCPEALVQLVADARMKMPPYCSCWSWSVPLSAAMDSPARAGVAAAAMTISAANAAERFRIVSLPSLLSRAV